MVNTNLIWCGLCLLIPLLNLSSCNNHEREDREVDNSANLIELHEKNTTVDGHITFVAADKNEMSLDHSYTNEALIKLATATNAMATEIGYEVQNDFGKVNTYADEIRKDPFETSHADDIRKAADILTNELQAMQRANYPTLEKGASELRDAAVSINPEVLTLAKKMQ